MCASVLVPFEETITIDVSEFEPGDYTVVVNETATTTLTINYPTTDNQGTDLLAASDDLVSGGVAQMMAGAAQIGQPTQVMQSYEVV